MKAHATIQPVAARSSGTVTQPEQLLAQLEHQRAELVTLRNSRIAAAEEQIRKANREFDRDAVTLGRRINKLRDKIEDRELNSQIAREVEPDPSWSEEDQTHYRELRVSAANGTRSNK